MNNMTNTEQIRLIKRNRLSKTEQEIYNLLDKSILIPNKKDNIDEYVFNNKTYIQIKHNKKVIYFNNNLFTYVTYNMYDTSVYNVIKNYFSNYCDYELYSKRFFSKFDIYQISIF